MLTRGLFWYLFPKLWSNEGIKNQNNTRVSTETIRHESVYIILFLTRHNKSINDDKNNNLYTLSQSLIRSVFALLVTSQWIADAQWPDNCDVIMWRVVSNSLEIHFTSIRPTIPEIELFRNLTLKHPRSRSWVRSKVKVTYYTQYLANALPFCFTSIGPTIPEIWPK